MEGRCDPCVSIAIEVADFLFMVRVDHWQYFVIGMTGSRRLIAGCCWQFLAVEKVWPMLFLVSSYRQNLFASARETACTYR